jgi:hypothetical protein
VSRSKHSLKSGKCTQRGEEEEAQNTAEHTREKKKEKSAAVSSHKTHGLSHQELFFLPSSIGVNLNSGFNFINLALLAVFLNCPSALLVSNYAVVTHSQTWGEKILLKHDHHIGETRVEERKKREQA